MSQVLDLTQTEERQILDAAPDAMIVVNAEGKITYTNRQTEKLFGYTREELLGKPLDFLLPARFHKTHGGHVARYFSSPVTRPMGSGLELFGRRNDGAELQIEVSLSPVHTERGLNVAAAIRDISQRKRIEAAAKLNADRLASAVESTEDPVAIFDTADLLALCNSAYRRLMADCAPGALVGRGYPSLLESWLSQLAFAGDAEKSKFHADRIQERREAKSSFQVRTKDGRTLRVTNRRTIEGGIVQTIWDLTDDVRREEELQHARAQAEAGSAAKSEFLSSMSHELRTPLNAILGFAQLLQRDKKEPLSMRHKERVDHIVKGGEHLLRLIDDILDLSRIEAGRVSISTEPVGLKDVLVEVTNALSPAAQRQQVRIHMVAPTTDVPMVLADRTRLVQILMNLGSNAIKYTRPGGEVAFRVSESSSGLIRVCVSDTGIGIPQDKQDKVFQPFQRMGQETGPIEGTGIGLVITKRLVELMKGDIGFRSTSDGSEFWVDLPAQVQPHAVSVFPTASEIIQGAVLEGGQRHVIYVEDNPANVAFMRDLVENLEGIKLVTAPTAEIGVELAREHKPDVVIMDINLPGMSGLDALHLLRQDPETQHIPVIALTAAASERDKLRGVQAGFFRYLTKPVKVDELIGALEALLEAPRVSQ